MNKLIIIISCVTMGISSEGTIGGVTFFDFSLGRTENDSTTTSFNIQRQYISYIGKVSENIKYKIIFDVGRTNVGAAVIKKDTSYISEDTRLVAFLKKAQIDYKTSYGKVSMGLIGMNTYNVQEKNWGYRFIEKSAIDKYGFSPTSDLGIGISKSLIENLNMSLQITNGEGYKKNQEGNLKISCNATYGEGQLNKNDGYNAGVVFSEEYIQDIWPYNGPTNLNGVFGGFSGMGLRLGIEYNMMRKHYHYKETLFSVYANYGFLNNLDAYVRYDIWDDNDSANNNGEYYFISGILLNCDNGLSVAPNMRMTTYEDTAKEFSFPVSRAPFGNHIIIEYKLNFQFIF